MTLLYLIAERHTVDENGPSDAVKVVEEESLAEESGRQVESSEIPAAEPLVISSSELAEFTAAEPTSVVSGEGGHQTYSLREEIHLDENGREQHVVFLSEDLLTQSAVAGSLSSIAQSAVTVNQSAHPSR